MRMGTWNVCMFVSFEQLKKLSGQYKLYRAEQENTVPLTFGAIVMAEEHEDEEQ